MKNLKIFTLFLPLLIMNSLAALETPELTLPVMPKSPVIDGIVNESEYKYAARMQGTCLNTRTLNGKLYPAEMIFYIGDGQSAPRRSPRPPRGKCADRRPAS